MKRRLRKAMLDFKPYVPGLTIEEIREKYGLDTVIKLSSNENPLGASPMVQKVLGRRAGEVFRYPRNHAPDLAAAVADRFGVDPAGVVVGNGSDEIIDLLYRVVAEPGQDEAICYEHCFSMYRMCAKLCGVAYREIKRGPNLALPLDGLAGAATDKTALVFVTSPDNPTGLAATADDLETLARALPDGTLLVVDGAYMEFAEPAGQYEMAGRIETLGNVVMLRTFSKVYGLGGMRLGYGIMPVWLADAMRAARIPFTVNILAEQAGLAALEDHAFMQTTLETVRDGKTYLMGELERLGCAPVPSHGNFIMFTPTRDAMDVFEGLLERGVIVRPLKSFGLPDFIRVNLGTDAENRAFIKVLEDIL